MSIKQISSKTKNSIIKFLKTHNPNDFTQSAYEELYLLGPFIAHFDKNGFINARFLSSDAIGYTSKILKLHGLDLETEFNDLNQMNKRLEVIRLQASIAELRAVKE